MLPDINEYFRRFTYDPLPERGSKPTETAWTSVGELEVKGHRIHVGDSWAIGIDSIDFAVPPGKYVITAECYSYATDGRVARLRGLLPGRQHNGSALQGDFGVDVASAGVIDADAVDAWAAADEEGFESWIDGFTHSRLDDHDTAGFYPCEEAGVVMVHTSTGFGDGSYDAFTLLDGNEVVGFELVFIKPGEGYFGEEEQTDA